MATEFENEVGKNSCSIWPDNSYFKQQPCDFHLDKENIPENSIFYINQGQLSYKDNKKLYYTDYYILGQVTECLNPLENIENYVCKVREVNMHRPRYDPVSEQFFGLYESIGYITVRGDLEEQFCDYGFCKEKSKILYSHHKKIIPRSFSGIFFNRHKTSYESGALPTYSSNVYFFLPPTTDRVEDINIYMGSVNLLPIEIVESSFETEENVSFDPSKLDTSCPEKKSLWQLSRC